MNTAEIKSDNCSILATYFILKILSSVVDVCNMILNGCYKGALTLHPQLSYQLVLSASQSFLIKEKRIAKYLNLYNTLLSYYVCIVLHI